MQNRGFAQSVLGQEAGIQTADDTRAMGADQFNVGTKMDAERLRESLRQQGLLGYLDAASRISANREPRPTRSIPSDTGQRRRNRIATRTVCIRTSGVRIAKWTAILKPRSRVRVYTKPSN